MKVLITDRIAFESLNPTDVAAYLNQTGWKEVEHKPGHSSTWQRAWKGETAELLLPLNRSISDYLFRIENAVRLIAALEDRSELEVFYDLQAARPDIIIDEPSRVLRGVASREESEITGYVVKLQRSEGQGPLTGPVTVTTLIDGQMRKVSINLEEPDHQTALAAYERGVPIACRGDLVKQAQLWSLRNPRGFTLTNEE